MTVKRSLLLHRGFAALVSCTLLCLASSLRAEHDHKNWVYFNFYDAANNPLAIQDATFAFGSDQLYIESAQNPDDNEPVMSYTAGSNQLAFMLNVGRHHSNNVADDFKSKLVSSSGQQPNVLTMGINDNENTYYCQQMNFYWQGTWKWIQISDTEYISFPNMAVGQSANSFWKVVLNIVDQIGATAWDTFMTAADIEDGDEFAALGDGLNVFNDVITGGQSIAASFDNFWMIAQSLETYDTNDLIMSSSNSLWASAVGEDDDPEMILPNPFTIPSLPDNHVPLIINAYYQNTDTPSTAPMLIPVYITGGSDDHTFNLYVPYPFTLSSSNSVSATAETPAAVFKDATQVSDNFFLDPSIGIFEKYPNTPWIWGLNLGWCYPDGDYAPDLWIYSNREDDWYYISKDVPGMLYKSRTGIWYAYDSTVVRHIPLFDLVELEQ